MIERTQEFEKQRLNVASTSAYSAAEGETQISYVPGVAAGSAGLNPAQIANRIVVLKKTQGLPEGKVQGNVVPNKIVLFGSGSSHTDPYANMYYDAYGSGEKGKGHFMLVKGKWSEMVDDEVAWWYLPYEIVRVGS